MTNIHLPQHILDSLGYKNLSNAVKTVLGEKFQVIEVKEDTRKGEVWYDDFKMLGTYNSRKIILWVSETRAEGMMHRGEGGGIFILLPSQFEFSWNEWYNSEDLYDLVSPEDSYYLKHEGSVGANEQAIEKSLQILKKYLDKQED